MMDSDKTTCSKVVSLHGSSVEAGEPCPEIIRLAEGVLERAKKGELLGLGVALVAASRLETDTAWEHDGCLNMLHAASHDLAVRLAMVGFDDE